MFLEPTLLDLECLKALEGVKAIQSLMLGVTWLFHMLTSSERLPQCSQLHGHMLAEALTLEACG